MLNNILNRLDTITVLVVEDDEIARVAIKQALKPYCKNYYEANNGAEGIETFKKYHIDIIVTDIHMPIINGFEMISEILKIKPNQLFIVMTSYDTDENFLNSIEEGACSYLRKPLDIQELQTSLLINIKQIKYTKVQLSKNILIDYQNQMIYKDGTPVCLSYKINKMFWLFCYNINKLVSYEMIEEYVYDNVDFINRKTINMAIQRIKQSLGTVYIKNVPSIGYIMEEFKTKS